MAITYRTDLETRLSVEQMDENFHFLENSLESLGANGEVISGLTTSVITLSTNLASATASIGTLNTNLASATASIGTLNTNLASATASIATLSTNLASATASIVTLNTNVAGLTASVIDLQNAFSDVTGSFNFLLKVSGVTQSGTFSFTNGILATYSLA